MNGNNDVPETGKSQIMGSSEQPRNGIKQEIALVIFVFSVELIGRCVKNKFARDKTRTT